VGIPQTVIQSYQGVSKREISRV